MESSAAAFLSAFGSIDGEGVEEVLKVIGEKTADLSSLSLTVVPSELSLLSGLRTLSLAHNRLRTLSSSPLTTARFPELVSLSLAHNALEHVPLSLVEVQSQLRSLSVEGNAFLRFPPIEIADQGAELTVEYIKVRSLYLFRIELCVLPLVLACASIRHSCIR